MQMKSHLENIKLCKGNYELLTEHLKSKCIYSSLYNVNQKTNELL